MNLLDQLPRLDLSRIKGYQALLDFYKGSQWEGRNPRGEKRLTFNYAKVAVDKITSYLMSGVNPSTEPGEDSEAGRRSAQAAETALRAAYSDNNLAELDFETEIDCAILGDGAFKVTWDEGEGRVRVTAPDVQGLYAWWRGDDTARVWRVASRYQLSDEEAELLYQVRLPK